MGVIYSVADPVCLYRNPNPTFSIPDPDLHKRIEVILTQKSDAKFSKISSGMFIPDPGSGSRIQGSKKHRILDPEHWLFVPLQLQIMNTIFGLGRPVTATIEMIQMHTKSHLSKNHQFLLTHIWRLRNCRVTLLTYSTYLCRWFRFAQLAKGKKSRP